MDFKKKKISAHGIKITIEENGEEVARGYLYIMTNDLHTKPFAFMEDVFVVESLRGKGYGKKIVQELIEDAKREGCYKLIGTSRFERDNVHKFYEEFGFIKYGYEFRMNLTDKKTESN